MINGNADRRWVTLEKENHMSHVSQWKKLSPSIASFLLQRDDKVFYIITITCSKMGWAGKE